MFVKFMLIVGGYCLPASTDFNKDDDEDTN